jgi:hypothetical protein
MDDYSAQQDEGYSEDPLNPFSTFSNKLRDDLHVGAEFPAWLTRQINNLSISDKTSMFSPLSDSFSGSTSPSRLGGHAPPVSLSFRPRLLLPTLESYKEFYVNIVHLSFALQTLPWHC